MVANATGHHEGIEPCSGHPTSRFCAIPLRQDAQNSNIFAAHPKITSDLAELLHRRGKDPRGNRTGVWPLPSCVCKVRVLGRRGFALESAAIRISTEAGGLVSTNCLMRDLDLPVFATDSRRGSGVFLRVSWLSTPHWCARCTVMAPLVTVHPTGTAWFLRQLADVGPWSWARLVVLAVEDQFLFGPVGEGQISPATPPETCRASMAVALDRNSWLRCRSTIGTVGWSLESRF